MKILVIITTILVVQVSASFFDVFHGAVLSVQNSFGKLLRDVVTDVTVTVDCTILAVEHVLSLSPDATTRYYEKCGSETNNTDSVSDAQQDKSLPNMEVTLNSPNNEEYLEKEIPTEIDAKVNETLSEVLGNHTTYDNVLSVGNVLAKESEQLELSVVVIKEMEKLSNEVPTNLKSIEKQRDSEPSRDSSVDAILQEIKVLERAENKNNISEAYEMHQLIDKLLDKLDAIEATEATENIKLEEILKNLKTDNSFVNLRHQFEEWKKEESRHLGDIESHEKISDYLELNNKDGFNATQPVISKTDINRDGVESTLDSQELSDVNTTQVKQILDSSTSLRTIGEWDDQSSISVGNEPSSFQNNTLKGSGSNDTVITSSPTAIEFCELSTLSKNQSITQLSNLIADDTNKTMANTTYSITDGGPIIETIQPVNNTEESKSVTINKPTTILSTNENNYTETVIISNPLPETGIALDVFSQLVPVENNTDFRIDEDLATKNDTVIISEAGAETELIFTTQNSVIIDNANDSAITSISKTMLENTPVNVTNSENLETSTSTTNDMKSSTSKDVSMPIYETGRSIDTSAFIVNEESLTVTTKIVGDSDSNTSSIIGNTALNETIRSEETTLTTGEEESLTGIMQTVDDNDSNDTIKASSLFPIIEITTLGETIVETGPTLDDEETEVILINDDYDNDDDSNMTIFTNDSLEIAETVPVSETIELEETTTASGNKNSSNDSNDTVIKNTSLSIVESTPLSDTGQAKSITSSESLIETTMELSNNSNNVNLNDSGDFIINTTPTPLISNYETEVIEAIDTTTDSTSEDKPLSSAETTNTKDDINVTALTILESISKESIPAAKNEEPLLWTTNSTTVSTTPLIDTDSNTDIKTSTLLPPSEITTVTEIVKPVESNTSLENEEPIILSINSPETIENEEVTNDDMNSNDEVTNTTLRNVDSEAATEAIETIAASEEQMSSTSTSALNETKTKSTAFPPTECIPVTNDMTPVENTTASSYEEGLTSPITDTLSSSTPKIQTRQLLINPEVPYEIPLYGQTVMPPITSGLANEDPKLFTSDTLILNDPNQQTKLENHAQVKAAFDAFDSIHERLLHSESLFGPEKDILKIPSTPLITIAPKLNLKYPSNMPTPRRQPYSFDTTSAETDKPPPGALTTHTTTKTDGPANNDRTHTPQKDSEVHQRAVKEARQPIANSKRPARIMNSIMKNKNKYNARSISN